jgi:flagellar assembly protein FliH
MSNTVSKGEMSAFQRWEMASFGEDKSAPTADQLARASATARINQIDIDNAREEARRLGFAEGHASGLAEGRVAGQVRLDAEVAQFHVLTAQFSEQLNSANKAIGEDVFKLAVDLAQAMLRSKLEMDPETIIPILLEAIDSLPSVQQPAQINLHPADALIIKANMGERLITAGWRIISDPRVERGGCTLETAQNLVDATFDTRWQRLTEAIKAALYTSGAT